MTARPFTPNHDGLEVAELTWEDYLALAGLEPLDDTRTPAMPVTLTEEPNNAP